jgi:hypothetical protein
MIGGKALHFTPMVAISLDALVPADRFTAISIWAVLVYQQAQSCIDQTKSK